MPTLESLNLINDERGFVISSELVLVSSIAVVGLIGGLTALSSGISTEISSFTNRLQTLREDSLPVERIDREDVQGLNCTVMYRHREGRIRE